MQALSFAVHIPLVCFGIAFPVMVLVVEWLHMRTGDPVYLTLARRWTKVMLALFAAGVVTGTVLSFEMGLLWPEFTAVFGSVFGLGFAIEGFSFFLEAIFIGIYAYGWDRLSPRMHFASGIPIVIPGFLGSLMVISVNGWMNHPTGFRLVARQGGRRPSGGRALPQPQLLARAGAHVRRRLHGHRVPGRRLLRRVRGCAAAFGRYERTALVIPLTIAVRRLADPGARSATGRPGRRREPAGQAGGVRGPRPHDHGRARPHPGYLRGRRGALRHPHPRHALAARVPRPARHRHAASTRCPPRDRPPVNVVRFSFQTMVGIGSLLFALSIVFVYIRVRRRRLPESPWFYRAVVLAGPLSVVALIAGWVTTEVGRQPWVVYRIMRTSQAVTGAGGIPVGYATLAAVYFALGIAVGLGAGAARSRPRWRTADHGAARRSRSCSCWPASSSTSFSAARTSAPACGS